MEERQRWNWAAIARRKGVNERPADDVPVAYKSFAVRNGQKTFEVMIEDTVAPASEVAAGTMSAERLVRASDGRRWKSPVDGLRSHVARGGSRGCRSWTKSRWSEVCDSGRRCFCSCPGLGGKQLEREG